MFTCPICGDLIITSKLCSDCETIRQLTKIYGKDKVLEVLRKVMVVRQLDKKSNVEKEKNEVREV